MTHTEAYQEAHVEALEILWPRLSPYMRFLSGKEKEELRAHIGLTLVNFHVRLCLYSAQAGLTEGAS